MARDTGSGDIMIFVCYLTLQYHMIKALNDFMVKKLSMYITILPSLVAISTVIVDILVFVCHVISQNCVIKGSYDFMGRSSLM